MVTTDSFLTLSRGAIWGYYKNARTDERNRRDLVRSLPAGG